jgi:hypothetical protein
LTRPTRLRNADTQEFANGWNQDSSPSAIRQGWKTLKNSGNQQEGSLHNELQDDKGQDSTKRMETSGARLRFAQPLLDFISNHMRWTYGPGQARIFNGKRWRRARKQDWTFFQQYLKKSARTIRGRTVEIQKEIDSKPPWKTT